MAVDNGGYEPDSELDRKIHEVLGSEAFTKRLVKVVDAVVTRRATHKCGCRSEPFPRHKRCRCARCCPPRIPSRPIVTVMLLPIPIINPFWWADSCHQRPCGPTIPECCHEQHPCGPTTPEYCHEDSDQMPPADSPRPIG